MGMDIYIDRVKNPVIRDGQRKYNEREEMCYWRKNYGLITEGIPFNYGNDEYAEDVRLTKGDVEQILTYLCHHRDYFDSFDTVVSVCELLDKWDEYEEDGWKFVFNANW